MKPLVFLNLAVIICLFSCGTQGQSNTTQEEKLSEDFDSTPPFYYKMPDYVTAIDTSPSWEQGGQNILLTGIVYQPDGKTPANDVLMYYYQTNSDGIYAVKADEPLNMPKNKLGQTHGYIRGWVKTGADGRYSIYTTMPGSYPNRNEPAHIHICVVEKNMEEPYYLADFVFDNDKLLTSKKRVDLQNRGGSGIIRFVKKDDVWIGERNIFLGLNIPNYPKFEKQEIQSGRAVGEDVLSFTPYHAYGPDQGTKTCPVCKYGWFHGILYFVGNNPDWVEIKKWLTFLDAENENSKVYLKTYFVYGDEQNYSKEERISKLEKLGKELQLKHIALTFVPSFSDHESEIFLNEIDPDEENTFIIYRRSNIIGKFVNLKPTKDNFDKLLNRLDETENEYFKMERVRGE